MADVKCRMMFCKVEEIERDKVCDRIYFDVKPALESAIYELFLKFVKGSARCLNYDLYVEYLHKYLDGVR